MMSGPSLKYIDVHFYFTLPIIIILWLICRPFIDFQTRIKFYSLTIIALIYTTPWDNYIVFRNAWWYPPNSVLAVIGYIPVEEYMFFVIQTLMTSFWCFLCMRWSFTSLYLEKNNRYKEIFVKYVPVGILLSAAIYSWSICVPSTKLFYMTSIFWWILPVIAFLWYGVGNYVLKRLPVVALSIAVPTIYLCFVDYLALRSGAWFINPKTSLEVFIYGSLPIEEALFFFIVNVTIVLAWCKFDKIFCIMDTYPELYKDHQFLIRVVLIIITPDSSLPQQAISDLKQCIRVLNVASKSFSTASSVFATGIRQDLTSLYAFCRVTDDMVDDAPTSEERKNNIKLIIDFLDELFKNRTVNNQWIYDIGGRIDCSSCPQINWKYYEDRLEEDKLAAFRSIARISYYLPAEPFYELVKGYQWDMDSTIVKNEHDLVLYSNYVASSVAVLCTFVICYKSGNYPHGLNAKDDWMIKRAREQGVALQLVNIARDIATDSETLGRCYVPLDFLIDKEKELKSLKEKRDPWSLGQDRLRLYAINILSVADAYNDRASFGVLLLPKEAQGAVLTATEIYQGIGKLIRERRDYVKRVSLGKLRKIRIAFNCMYLKRSSKKKIE